MIARAMHFTPEVLLSAPRRSAGLPNPSGTTVLYSVSTYDFQSHSKTATSNALDIKSNESHELVAAGDAEGDISDFNWLDDDAFVALSGQKDGTTKIVQGSVKSGKIETVLGQVQAGAGNLRIAKLEDGAYAAVLSAPVGRDGELWTPERAARKTRSTGRLFDKLFVRHWDRYDGPDYNALWYGKLAQDGGQLKLSTLTNALKGTGLESPIQPFGGADHFDVSADSIIFVAKDPKLNPALNTKVNVYLRKIEDWSAESKDELKQIEVKGFEGASTSPVFSPKGDRAAFLSMKRPGYEADKNRVFVVDVSKADAVEAFASDDGLGAWDRSAGSVAFTPDGESLILTAEVESTGQLFITSSDITKLTSAKEHLPKALTSHGTVSSARPLADGSIFVSGASLIDNSWYAIIDSKADLVTSAYGLPPVGIWSHSNSAKGSKFGLSADQVTSIRTPANNPKVNKEVHSIVVYPSTYQKGQKLPVAYLIHGGPQGSWGDSWSTRWHPAVYAEQGYIVVAPNPTGSTGYGQAFTDAIRGNWGGDPYEDIVKVFEWVGANLEGADNERAVALGASYGGYMMNWIQGHDLGRKFKTLVNHDGIFSFAGGLLPTEELYFPFHDLEGAPWDAASAEVSQASHKAFGSSNVSNWRKWDPSEHLSNWSTPQLTIHSDKDYRLSLPEGLAAFNVLQARGVESQFLTFPDENHWVLKPENGLVWHKVVLNWINKYAGLPAYTDEDPESEEFWGGVGEAKDEKMPIQGKPES